MKKSTVNTLCVILILLVGVVGCSKKPKNDNNVTNNKEMSSTEITENNISSNTNENGTQVVDEDIEDTVEYAKAGFSGERNASFDESEDGTKLENFKVELIKDSPEFKGSVTDYTYEYKDKKYKGDLKIDYTGGTEGNYYATYTGELNEV